MNAYATNKIRAHPIHLEQLRTGQPSGPITVHLMPQNVCNQRCSFCSYRMPDNKNSEAFDEGQHLPWTAMADLLRDLHDLGVRGIELTGGGEPLAYPHIRELIDRLVMYNFDIGLVTNGTLMRNLAPTLGPELTWARVSIDAATATTYCRMRGAPHEHFDRAWKAVAELRHNAPADEDFRLGVGFVLSNENLHEVYEFVRMARESGADNVRLSSTFSDQGMGYFGDPVAVERAIGASIRAFEDFHDDETFRVHNLLPWRHLENLETSQDYPICPTAQVLCVVEGSGKVYTCCTFTGSDRGCYGNILEHPGGFKGIWKAAHEWRRSIDPRQMCQVSCMYRERNLNMIELIDAPEMPPSQEHIHEAFI